MEEVLLSGTDCEVFWCLFFLPPSWQADADSPEGGPSSRLLCSKPPTLPLPPGRKYVWLRAQIAKIMSLKCIAGHHVKVAVHPTLILCKHVVTHEDFGSESEEVLKSFFEPKCVVNFHTIRQKVIGNFVPSATHILTFNRASFQIIFVEDFSTFECGSMFQIPLCCFKCQRFGHTQEHCMSQAICVSCGQKAHSPPCQSSPDCINCDGPHGSSSLDCPKFHMERVIQKIRATDKVSFPEARLSTCVFLRKTQA